MTHEERVGRFFPTKEEHSFCRGAEELARLKNSAKTARDRICHPHSFACHAEHGREIFETMRKRIHDAAAQKPGYSLIMRSV